MGKTRIGIALSLAAAALWAAVSFAGESSGIGADEALRLLMDGNRRFVEGGMTLPKGCDAPARQKLAKGQKPYAIVLCCSDSRVPPEVIFDKGLGEIFVVRVAGNVADPVVLGSIEYAAEHLGSPLVMVLGHERCGAVTAAVDAKGKPEGNIGAIVKKIVPAVAQARREAKGKPKEELVETAIGDNVRLAAAGLTKASPVLRELVKEGKLKIVAAKYSLDDGKVTSIELARQVAHKAAPAAAN